MRVKISMFTSNRGERVTHLMFYNSESPYQFLGACNIYGEKTFVFYKDADENSQYNGPINGASNIKFDKEMEAILDKVAQENEARNKREMEELINGYEEQQQ